MSTVVLKSIMNVWPLRIFGEDFLEKNFVEMNCRGISNEDGFGKHGLCVNSTLSNFSFDSIQFID